MFINGLGLLTCSRGFTLVNFVMYFANDTPIQLFYEYFTCPCSVSYAPRVVVGVVGGLLEIEPSFTYSFININQP